MPAPPASASTCVENTDEKPGTFVSAYWDSFPRTGRLGSRCAELVIYRCGNRNACTQIETHTGSAKEKTMMKQLPATVMVCSEYQRLLEESARAREAWSNLRYEVCWAELIPKKTIHELLRLQAKYARAYTLLQKHVHSCGRCEPLPKTA